MEFDNLNESDIEKADVLNACKSGNIPFINEYLASGHGINDCVSSGWTLLLYASSCAQPDVVQHLLDSGANPNTHSEGFTPLMALSNTAKNSPSQRFTCLQYLIKARAHIEMVSKLRETALMFACKMQEPDFVSELLKYTTDVNYTDSEQKTALFYAVADNRYENAKLLIEKGADATWKNFRGHTVYDIAITKGYDQLISLLDKDEKPDEKEVVTAVTSSGFNMFSTMAEVNTSSLDNDVASILDGMGFDVYKPSFCGMNLKTILLLEEEDLIKLGIDISAHRKRFIEDLLRFHKQEWNSKVLTIDQSQPFTPYEAIRLLGNLNRQLSVMTCSIKFAQGWFNMIKKTGNLTFSNNDQQKYEIYIQEMQKIASQVQDEVLKIKHTAALIHQENSHLTLPIYISKKSRFNHKWITLTLATTIVGLYLIRMKSN